MAVETIIIDVAVEFTSNRKRLLLNNPEEKSRHCGSVLRSELMVIDDALGSLAHGFNRQEQTLLARFRRSHLTALEFYKGSKSFEMCMNCSSEPALPAHILECLGQDLADNPLLVCMKSWTWPSTAGQ
ncbi:uncharacterized protein TNCV_441201 [Trichonephila clavipes]|nr:uncharacterized protein TNCV_441201 [Trichonephila clavipes]